MSLVSFRDLTVDNTTITTPQPKQFTGENSSGEYHSSEIKYKYDTGSVDKFKLELCEVTCSPIYKSGDKKDDKVKAQQIQLQVAAQEQPKKKKLDKYYVRIELDVLGDNNAKECAEKMDALHVQFAKLFAPFRGKWNHHMLMSDSSNMAEKTGFKPLLRWTRDELSGDRIDPPRKNPFQYFNLVFGENDEGRQYQTNFYDLGKKDATGKWIKPPAPIDWEILKNSVMTGYPVIHYRSSWANDGKLSIQTQLSSFVVTSIKKREYSIQQLSHVEDLIASHPEMQEKLDDEIAELAGMLTLTSNSSESTAKLPGAYDPKTDNSSELSDASEVSDQLNALDMPKMPNSMSSPGQLSPTVNLPTTQIPINTVPSTQADNLQQFLTSQQAPAPVQLPNYVQSPIPGQLPGQVPPMPNFGQAAQTPNFVAPNFPIMQQHHP